MAKATTEQTTEGPPIIRMRPGSVSLECNPKLASDPSPGEALLRVSSDQAINMGYHVSISNVDLGHVPE